MKMNRDEFIAQIEDNGITDSQKRRILLLSKFLKKITTIPYSGKDAGIIIKSLQEQSLELVQKINKIRTINGQKKMSLKSLLAKIKKKDN